MKIKDVLAEMAKKDDAEALYLQHVINSGMSRSDFISLLQKQLGMTPAGAATYYHNAKTAHTAGKISGSPASPIAPAALNPAHAVSTPRAAKVAPVPVQAAPAQWLLDKKVNATINPSGLYDVQGDVDLGPISEKELPIAFGHVAGNFLCSGGDLMTLKGCPTLVDGDFFVDHNQLASLVGGPTAVGLHVTVSGNEQLSSLEGAPQQIGGKLYLQALPNLKSLQNIHKSIKQINGVIDLTGTPIQSNVLGLLMIKKLPSVKMDNKKVMEIINKHLAADRDIHQCQEELLEAGLANFARL
jgi:hypothetical protein